MKPFNTPIKMPDSQTFNMILGVLGLAIQSSNNTERLYFGTLSKELYSIPITYLDFSLNETLLSSDEIQNHGKRIGSCDSLVSDDQQNIYMGLVDKTSIVKWNSSKSINIDENNQEIVLDDPILQWINSL